MERSFAPRSYVQAGALDFTLKLGSAFDQRIITFNGTPSSVFQCWATWWAGVPVHLGCVLILREREVCSIPRVFAKH